jgi:hypothetical protein
MLIPNVRDSMTIALGICAKEKYRLTEMCPHDRYFTGLGNAQNNCQLSADNFRISFS